MKVSDLLVRIRDALNDNGERWTDDKLIRLIDEAQTDIVSRFKLLRTSTTIYLLDGQKYVDLPKDLLWLDRVAFNNQVVPLTAYAEMDKRYLNWVTDKGRYLEYVVVDKLNRGRIRLYPIIQLDVASNFERGAAKERETFQENLDVGEVVGMDTIDVFNQDTGFVVDIKNLDSDCDISPVDMSSDYGIVIDIVSYKYYDVDDEKGNYGEVVSMSDSTFNQDDGFVVDIRDENQEVHTDSDYGLIVGYTESDSFIEVFYIRRPKPLTSKDDELEIDDVYAKAIKHYVVGMCFREDLDVQNRSIGNEELQLYEQAVQQAKRDSFRDFVKTSSPEKYSIQYTGFM